MTMMHQLMNMVSLDIILHSSHACLNFWKDCNSNINLFSFYLGVFLICLILLPGLARCPKWGHLKDLHRSIKLCEHALLNGEPSFLSLGPLQEVNYGPFSL